MDTNLLNETPCRPKPARPVWVYFVAVAGILVVALIMGVGVMAALTPAIAPVFTVGDGDEIAQEEFAEYAAVGVTLLVFGVGILCLLWPEREHFIAGWQNALDFQGKATRTQYWIFGMMNMAVFDAVETIFPPLYLLCELVIFVPVLSMICRRLTDAGIPKFFTVVPALLVIASIEEHFANPDGMFFGSCYLLVCLVIGLVPTAFASWVESRKQAIF